MKTVRVLCAFVLLLCTSGIVTHAQDNPEQQATAAAKSWLSQLDAGLYAEGWRDASLFFRGAVNEPDWVDALIAFRTPLGKLESRTLKGAQRSDSLPGAPDGNYVVLLYDTSFEHKAVAVETVTFMQEESGEWKAAGYFIK